LEFANATVVPIAPLQHWTGMFAGMLAD